MTHRGSGQGGPQRFSVSTYRAPAVYVDDVSRLRVPLVSFTASPTQFRRHIFILGRETFPAPLRGDLTHILNRFSFETSAAQTPTARLNRVGLCEPSVALNAFPRHLDRVSFPALCKAFPAAFLCDLAYPLQLLLRSSSSVRFIDVHRNIPPILGRQYFGAL